LLSLKPDQINDSIVANNTCTVDVYSRWM